MGGLSRRGVRYAGVTMLLFPIWYPYADEGAFRWPRAEDLPYIAFAWALGLALLLLATRIDD